MENIWKSSWNLNKISKKMHSKSSWNLNESLVEIWMKKQWQSISNPVDFLWNTKRKHFEVQLKFNRNFNEMPIKIHQKKVEISKKSIGNPVEILLTFQLYTNGNQLEIQLWQNGNFNEILIVMNLTFQWKTVGNFIENEGNYLKIQSKFQWNTIGNARKSDWKPLQIQLNSWIKYQWKAIQNLN